MLNGRPDFQTLPADVIQMVFELVAALVSDQDLTPRVTQLYILSQISSRLRGIALSTPSLWARLPATAGRETTRGRGGMVSG